MEIDKAILVNYPNLEAVLEGRVSGQINDWVALRNEIEILFATLINRNTALEAEHEKVQEWIEKYNQAVYEGGMAKTNLEAERQKVKELASHAGEMRARAENAESRLAKLEEAIKHISYYVPKQLFSLPKGVSTIIDLVKEVLGEK